MSGKWNSQTIRSVVAVLASMEAQRKEYAPATERVPKEIPEETRQQRRARERAEAKRVARLTKQGEA